MRTASETHEKYVQHAHAIPCSRCKAWYTRPALTGAPGTHYCCRCQDWFTPGAVDATPSNQPGSVRIALSGRAGAGKNTVADIITRLTGAAQYSFAEALRKEVAAVTLGEQPIPADLIRRSLSSKTLARLVLNLWHCQRRKMDPWAKPTHPSMRTVLQLWGTDYRRAEDPDYWVRMMKVTGDKAVITDRRFENESLPGFTNVYVWRSEFEAERPKHVSERLIKPASCHAIISNDGTLDELEAKVKALLKRLEQEQAA
jgi:hypothetical protein